MTRPISVVPRIASTTRAERTASHRMPNSAATIAADDQVRILGQRGEFLVRQRHRSGQTYADAMRRIEPERLGSARIALLAAAPGCSCV